MCALSYAAGRGDISGVKRLLESGSNVEEPDDFGCTPLYMAALRGSAKIVDLLLSKGAEINAQNKDGYTALMKAAQYGHAETVRYFKKKKNQMHLIDLKHFFTDLSSHVVGC